MTGLFLHCELNRDGKQEKAGSNEDNQSKSLSQETREKDQSIKENNPTTKNSKKTLIKNDTVEHWLGEKSPSDKPKTGSQNLNTKMLKAHPVLKQHQHSLICFPNLKNINLRN